LKQQNIPLVVGSPLVAFSVDAELDDADGAKVLKKEQMSILL